MRKPLRYIVAAIFLFLAAGLAWRLLDRPEPAPALAPPAEKTITVLEGWTNQDMAKYFSDQDLWPVADFLAAAGSVQTGYTGAAGPDLSGYAERFSWLPETGSLEGYLFPDTYRIFASSTPEEAILKMLENFERKLTAEMRAEIVRQGKTLPEIITLASLIEKEAPIDNVSGDDRDARLIGGVFENRLASGQALQSDATLSYIYSDTKPFHSGAELEIDSPYNTYKYPGLPPGPIGNPGLVAIKAAIYPLATEYNYFLTPTDSREVIYARTYQEHLQNKYKYLK